jgi:hypothetical protein
MDRPVAMPHLALLLLVLAGCGGGGGSPGGGGDRGQALADEGFRVVRTSPFHGEMAVPRDATVEIVLSESFRAASATPDAVRLREDSTDQAVAGTLELDADGRTIRLAPDETLTLATRYRLTVTTALESAAGATLAEDHEVVFTTAVSDGSLLPPPGPVTIRVLDSGSFSAVTSRWYVVARNSVEYGAMWARHRPPMPPGVGAPDVPPPTVDLAKEMVIAVFLGPRSWGDRVYITSVEEREGILTVVSTEVPGTAAVACHPYEIIAVSRRDGVVSFIHATAQ